MTKNNGNDRQRYDDIIHLPHHVSEVHLQMAPGDRAAQFSPFAALTGYEDGAVSVDGVRFDKKDVAQVRLHVEF